MRRRYHALPNAFLAVALIGAVVWGWRRRPVRVAVQGESMEPTLRPGDFLVAFRSGRVGRGALVVVEHPERPGYEMVKRVEALPGERVGSRTLRPDEYWVVGDRRDASTDSRTFGPVGRPAIRAVVRFRYWPPSRVGMFR